jgi:hypothetical protein
MDSAVYTLDKLWYLQPPESIVHKSDCGIVARKLQRMTRAFQNKLNIRSFESHKKNHL